MTSPSVSASAARFFLTPVAICILTALALAGIGDQYPFSPFPMYSDIGEEADVLFLTDQNDAPVPLSDLFGIGSAQAKKQWKDALYRTSKNGSKTRNHDEASAEEIAVAGQEFLTDMWKRGLGKDSRRKKISERGVTALTAKLMVVKLGAEGLDTSDVATLGTQVAPPLEGGAK